MYDPECIAIDNSIADLADKIGVDAANLQARSAYNGYVDAARTPTSASLA